MKKEYTAPEIQIALFETESIMAASGGLTEGGALGTDDAIELG